MYVDFVGSPDDEVEKAEGFTGEEGGGGYFRNFCDCPLCIRTGGYEGQFIFIFAQKVTKLQIHSHVKVNIGVTSHGQ